MFDSKDGYFPQCSGMDRTEFMEYLDTKEGVKALSDFINGPLSEFASQINAILIKTKNDSMEEVK